MRAPWAAADANNDVPQLRVGTYRCWWTARAVFWRLRPDRLSGSRTLPDLKMCVQLHGVFTPAAPHATEDDQGPLDVVQGAQQGPGQVANLVHEGATDHVHFLRDQEDVLRRWKAVGACGRAPQSPLRQWPQPCQNTEQGRFPAAVGARDE